MHLPAFLTRLAVLGGVTGLVIAQQPVATAPQPAPWLPLQPGACWVYSEQVVGSRGALPERTRTVTVDGQGALPDGQRVYQLRIETAGEAAPHFQCWSLAADGVRQHLGDVRRRGALDLDAGPMHWLAIGNGIQKEWQWTGPHDTAVDPMARPWQHRAELVDDDEQVFVMAGAFRAAHIRVQSQRDGTTQLRRDLWFVPGTGIVRDVYRDAVRQLRRELLSFTAGRDDAEDRLRAHLDRQLAKPNEPAWNNRPFVRWVDDLPEALLVPGRIAVVKTDQWRRLYYVDRTAVHRCDPDGGQSIAPAAMAAFGTETANPPDELPLHSVALLLAHAVAARQDLGNVQAVPSTLKPRREPPRDSHRQAIVEVKGGALDGTERRFAVFLTLRQSTDLQVVTDLDEPAPANAGR